MRVGPLTAEEGPASQYGGSSPGLSLLSQPEGFDSAVLSAVSSGLLSDEAGQPEVAQAPHSLPGRSLVSEIYLSLGVERAHSEPLGMLKVVSGVSPAPPCEKRDARFSPLALTSDLFRSQAPDMVSRGSVVRIMRPESSVI